MTPTSPAGIRDMPIMLKTPSPPRVLYLEGQVLVAEDLNDEQADRNAHRRLHLAAAHGWGVASGLGLRYDSGRVVVAPGYAIDGFGREIVVAEPIAIDVSCAEANLDLWLFYGRDESRPRGRWIERPETLATLAEGPIPIPSPDRIETITYPAPDDAAEEWPVYLGRVEVEAKPPGIDATSSPPRARLIGAAIDHPDGSTRLQLGPENAADRRRFAVRLADGAGGWTDAIVIDRKGAIALNGPLDLEPAVLPPPAGSTAKPRLVGPSLRLRPAIAIDPDCAATTDPGGHLTFLPLAAEPTVARPAQIYAVRPPKTPDPTAPPALRIELEHPGNSGDPTLYRLVIGTLKPETERKGADSDFLARVIIDSSGDVKVIGTLDVRGDIGQGPITADPNDPRLRTAIAKAWAQGLAAGASVLNTTKLNLTVSVPPIPPTKLAQILATITNAGPGTVGSIDAYIGIANNGTSVEGTKLGDRYTLSEGQSVTISFQFDAAGLSGSLEVAVSAAGADAQGAPVLVSTKPQSITIP